MALNILKHKWQKVTIVVLFAFIVLVLLPAVVINRYWSPVLADKVKSAILEGTDSLYRVSFKDARLHILRGEIVIYDIDFKPDTAIYNQMKKRGLAPNNLYELKLKKLVVANIHPFSLYFKRKLNISRIVLSTPELNISYQPNHTKDTLVKDKRTPWEMISKTLRLIHVGEILLNDASVKYQDYSNFKGAVTELKGMNLKANDLLIDSATQRDRSRTLYCRDIVTELYNYTGKTPNGLYTYHFKSAKLSTYTSKLDITGLDVLPVQPVVFFDKTFADRFTLHLSSIQLHNFNYLAFHRYRSFSASNLILLNGNFAVHSNPKHTDKKTDRIVTFPHVAIRKIKAAFNLDTLTISHLNLSYNEYKTGYNQIGTLSFDNTNGRFLNITNNTDSLKRNNIASARITTLFMNKGQLDVNFSFNLTDSANSYNYNGKLSSMDLKVLNRAVISMALIKVTSGKVNSLNFNIKSTNKFSTGTVKLLYTNLKLDLLKKDSTREKGYSKKKLATFFANNAVLSRSNPDKPGDLPRLAFVSYQRPINSPFFKTIWQTLLSGIKPCAGLGKAEEDRVKIQMTEHEKRKAERKRKKAERKLRKAREKAAKMKKING